MTIRKKIILVCFLVIINFHDSTLAKASLDGWIKVDSNWKYEENGVFKTGWIKYKDKWFFLDEAGVMKTGWVKVEDKWYYLNEEGEMVTGWVKYKDKWYYLNDNGSMATGWVRYNNQWYYLNSEGDMAVSTYIDSYWINGDGVRKGANIEGSTVSNEGSSTKIYDNTKPTFRIIKVEDKDGNGCIDEVTIRFNKEVAINNVLNFYLEGGGKSAICSSFYCDGINANLMFHYFRYGEGNNVPMNARDIKIINKNTENLTIHEAPWIKKANTDMNGNVMEEGFTAYYR